MTFTEIASLSLAALSLIATIVISISNAISAKYAQKMARNYAPKLYVKAEVVYSSYPDKETMGEYNPKICNTLGFAYKRVDRAFRLTVVNNGSAPAINVKLHCEAQGFVSAVEYDEMYYNLDPLGKVLHKEFPKEFHIEYLAPDEEHFFEFFNTQNYPKVLLFLNNLECEGDKFIEKKLQVLTYVHPEFDLIQDPRHLNMMFGVTDEWVTEDVNAEVIQLTSKHFR